MAETNLLKWLYGKSGSGSSRKNNFSAPVMTWTSSHCPSSRSRSSAWTQQLHSSWEHSRERCWLHWDPALTPSKKAEVLCCLCAHSHFDKFKLYRGRPWSVVSEWWRGSRSLCRAHRCLDLQTGTSAPVSQVLYHTRACVLGGDYLSSPPLWCISPRNVGLWSSPVNKVWPNGSQTRCLQGTST